MIAETIIRIDELEAWSAAEYERRYARRDKVRFVDALLNDLEMLNLADREDIPGELHLRVARFVEDEHHPIVRDRGSAELGIADWMEALYDVQDTLMEPMDGDV